MKRPILATLPALFIGVVTGCGAESPDPLSTEPAGVQLSRGNGGGSQDQDSRAIWTWHLTLSDAATPTRITGDGLNESCVAAAESRYRGEVDGVHARIFWWDPGASQSGDAVFDPDWSKVSPCPRHLRFALDGMLHRLGTFTNARSVMQLAKDEVSAPRPMTFAYVGLPRCESMRFGVPAGDGLSVEPGSGGVLVTRRAGGSTLVVGAKPEERGRWVVESISPHEGTCRYTAKGKTVDGATHYLPFRVTIDELYAGNP